MCRCGGSFRKEGSFRRTADSAAAAAIGSFRVRRRGSVAVIPEGHRVLAELRENDFFGEQSIITAKPTNASVPLVLRHSSQSHHI